MSEELKPYQIQEFVKIHRPIELTYQNEDADTACDIIEQLQAKLAAHCWIPVSERLPESRVKVLTINFETNVDENEPAVAWMSEDKERWWTYGNSTGGYRPTYWKPIDLPTKEDGNG